MKPFVIAVMFSLSCLFMVSAEEMVQLTLRYEDGVMSEVGQETIERVVKRSRSQQRGGRSGAASAWFWQVKGSDNSLVAEQYFADPTILCSGDHSKHVVLDSTEFVILVPGVEGGTVEIFFDRAGEAVPVGTVVTRRNTPTPVAAFSLKGEL